MLMTIILYTLVGLFAPVSMFFFGQWKVALGFIIAAVLTAGLSHFVAIPVALYLFNQSRKETS